MFDLASKEFSTLGQIVVKSGDDCRQEHLAVQLISHFYGEYLFALRFFFSIFLATFDFLVYLYLIFQFAYLFSLSTLCTCISLSESLFIGHQRKVKI